MFLMDNGKMLKNELDTGGTLAGHQRGSSAPSEDRRQISRAQLRKHDTSHNHRHGTPTNVSVSSCSECMSVQYFRDEDTTQLSSASPNWTLTVSEFEICLTGQTANMGERSPKNTLRLESARRRKKWKKWKNEQYAEKDKRRTWLCVMLCLSVYA